MGLCDCLWHFVLFCCTVNLMGWLFVKESEVYQCRCVDIVRMKILCSHLLDNYTAKCEVIKSMFDKI